jgi:membrane-associated phospholipid phosphatase
MVDVPKAPPLHLRWRTWVWVLVGALLFLVVLYWLDVASIRFVQGWPSGVRAIFETITLLGLSDYILIPALVLMAISAPLALLGRKYTPKFALWQMTGLYVFIFVAVGLPGLIANLVKRLIGRARPELLDTMGNWTLNSIFNDYTYQSFPSGHTTTAFATAMVVGFFSPRWLPAALFVAALVGLSRIIIVAHYPSDVIGGVVFGVFGALAIRQVFALKRWSFEFGADGRIAPRPLIAVQRLVKTSRVQASR